MKKLITGAAAAAMLGGLMLAPSSFAHEQGTDENAPAADGHCNESTVFAPVNDADQNLVRIYGEAPGEGQGCLVFEGEGGNPVHPFDDGHIGVYEKEDGTAGLYGSCLARGEGGHFSPWDPTQPNPEAGDQCTNDDT